MAAAKSGLEITSRTWPFCTESPSRTLRSATRPEPSEVTRIVLLTSGCTVPLALSSVGRSRLSTLTVWKSSGWSTVIRFGSTVVSCFVGAAFVLLEQARETESRAMPSSRAAVRRMRTAKSFGAATGGRAETAPQEAADCTTSATLEVNLELKKYIASDFMGSPRGPRPDSIGWWPTNRNRPGSRRPVARCGTRPERSGNPVMTPRRVDRKRESCPAPGQTAADTWPCKDAAESDCFRAWRSWNRRHSARWLRRRHAISHCARYPVSCAASLPDCGRKCAAGY